MATGAKGKDAKDDAARATRDGLARAIAGGGLAPEVQETAQALLTRLERPVRVSLMGPPGAGKSRIMALLAAEDVAPEGLRLPTLRLRHGPEAAARITLADGTVETATGEAAAPEALAARRAALIELQRDLPALRRISLLEVVAGADPAEQARGAAWAARETDIAIWVSRLWEPPERKIWAGLPDAVKVNAILALTHADRMADRSGTLARLQALEGDAFEKVLALDMRAALAARGADGTVNKEVMRASGGAGLIREVLRLVDRGRQALLDRADVLLLRHADAVPAAVPAAAPASGADPAPAPAPEPGPDAAPVPASAPMPSAPAPSGLDLPPPPPPPLPLPGPDARAPLRAAADRLTGLGAEMQADPDPRAVLARAADLAQDLAETLEEAADETGDAALQALGGAAQDAADRVQLMQIEGGDRPALEAVCLMVQMRRALEDGLAAAA